MPLHEFKDAFLILSSLTSFWPCSQCRSISSTEFFLPACIHLSLSRSLSLALSVQLQTEKTYAQATAQAQARTNTRTDQLRTFIATWMPRSPNQRGHLCIHLVVLAFPFLILLLGLSKRLSARLHAGTCLEECFGVLHACIKFLSHLLFCECGSISQVHFHVGRKCTLPRHTQNT